MSKEVKQMGMKANCYDLKVKEMKENTGPNYESVYCCFEKL